MDSSKALAVESRAMVCVTTRHLSETCFNAVLRPTTASRLERTNCRAKSGYSALSTSHPGLVVSSMIIHVLNYPITLTRYHIRRRRSRMKQAVGCMSQRNTPIPAPLSIILLLVACEPRVVRPSWIFTHYCPRQCVYSRAPISAIWLFC